MLSGDETLGCRRWDVLEGIKEKRAFVLGSGVGDEEYVRECGWVVVRDVREADLLLARGTFTVPVSTSDGDGVVRKEDDEEEYQRALTEALEVAASLRIPMLVSNPDKVRPDKDLSPMPGSIGDSYEALLSLSGGDGDGDESGVAQLVKRIGKPFPEVYELAFQLVDDDGDDDDRLTSTIMVGDALETDVTGGIRAGCATLWVTQDGIHSAAVNEAKEAGEGDNNGDGYEDGIQAVIRGYNNSRSSGGGEFISPTYVTPHFRW